MNTDKHKFIVEESQEGLRLDLFLSRHLMEYSRSYIQRALHQGNVSVFGKKPKSNYRVHKGDEVILEIVPYKEFQKIMPEQIELDVVYEDEHIILIDKQIGLIVHPAGSVWNGTLVNALLFHWREFSDFSEKIRPGLVHRLDKDTSGLMIIAKNDIALTILSKQFAEKSIKRRYVAFVNGKVELDEGIIEAPIGRLPGDRKKMAVVYSDAAKDAKTKYKVLKRYDGYTSCEMTLFTGRTHQIRVHMAHIEHPLLGDALYGGDRTISGRLISRQALHSHFIEFVHPYTKKVMQFSSDLPDDMKKLR